jgi:RNA polymerase sigma factor (sigma-70 family)
VALEQEACLDRGLRDLLEGGALAGLTDLQLLERIETGTGEIPERAFSALIQRHGPLVLRTCRRILRNEHDADDAFQATFVTLLRKRRALWVRHSLAPWLHRVAVRASLRARARASRRSEVERDPAHAVRGSRTDGDRTDLLAVIHQEIERLPEPYRLAVVLCDVEGESCEQAGRKLGCPVGTIGSRLARGRERLRLRLVHRGIAPAVAALAAAGLRDCDGAMVPSSLISSTIAGARGISLGAPLRGVADTISGRAFMMPRSVLFVAFLAVVGIGLSAATGFRASPDPQPPVPDSAQSQTQKAVTPKSLVPKAEPAALKPTDYGNDPIRYKDYLIATISNSLPVRPARPGEPFEMTSRMAVLYKDGAVKLWGFEDKDPVCPPLKDTTPIRNIGFLDGVGLLITVADDSFRIWHAASGELRKDVPGQVVRPIILGGEAAGESRLLSVDREGKTVTMWDLGKLEPAGSFRPEGVARVVGAGLSKDARVLATVSDDRSVTLWEIPSKRPFATLRSPSKALNSVFDDNACKLLKQPVLRLDDRFWETAGLLAPATDPDKK